MACEHSTSESNSCGCVQEPSAEQLPFSTSASAVWGPSLPMYKKRDDIPAAGKIFICCHMQTVWGLFCLHNPMVFWISCWILSVCK